MKPMVFLIVGLVLWHASVAQGVEEITKQMKAWVSLFDTLGLDTLGLNHTFPKLPVGYTIEKQGYDTLLSTCRNHPCSANCAHAIWKQGNRKEFNDILDLGDANFGYDYQPFVGVKCSEEGHITQIMLPYCGLSAHLPEEIGDLEHLTYLNLGSNNLNGSLPVSLTNLRTLKMLMLASNNFNYPPSNSIKSYCKLYKCFGLGPSIAYPAYLHGHTMCTAYGDMVVKLTMNGCKKCSLSYAWNIVALIALAVCGALAFLVARWYVSSPKRFSPALRDTSASISIIASHASLMKVVITMNLKWPEQIQRTQEAVSSGLTLDFLNLFDLFGMECIIPREKIGWVALFLYPLFWIVCMFMAYWNVLLVKCLPRRWHCCSKERRQELADKSANLLAIGLSIFGITVMQNLILDSNLRKYDWGDWLRVLLPWTFFVVVVFKYARETLVLANIWSGRFLCICKPIDMPHERLGARLLYFAKRFANHAPYYQFIVWTRQVLICVASIVISNDTVPVTGILGVLIVLGSLVVHRRIKPFVHDFQNLVESCMLGSLFVLLSYATMYTAFYEHIPAGFQIIFSVLIILVGIASLVVSFWYLRLHHAFCTTLKSMLMASNSESPAEEESVANVNIPLLDQCEGSKNESPVEKESVE